MWASRYLVAQPSVEKLRRFLEADRERIESLMPPPSARKRLPKDFVLRAATPMRDALK